MAAFEVMLSAILSTLLTIPSMLILYHKWIIPKILNGVRTELPPAIITIVDEKIGSFREYVTEQFESARAAIIGKAGNQKRLMGLAARFLEKNGVSAETLDTVAERYGQEILEALQKKAANNSAGESSADPFGTISE